MSQPPRVLVIGPASKVGVHVVEQLVARGLTPRVGLRQPTATAREDVIPVHFDFARPASFDAAVDGVDSLFVMWPPGAGAIKRSVLRLLEVARAKGARRVVFLSVFGAGSLRFLPHAQVERWLARSELEYTILRAGYFMQNLSATHRQDVVERAEVFVPAGRGHLALIDTRDVAAVAVKAMLEPGHARAIYELTGGESLDFYEVAAIMSAALGRPIVYRAPSLWSFARRWRGRALSPGMIAFMALEYAFTRLDRSGRVTGDVARVLGRPPLRFRQFVEDHRARWADVQPSR
ncbi:MAG: NAD(P)H-binding protein [Myxococcales bacterium]|nr:NAD(P)H-binding protein [Myxococcales bacterium]MCB9750951.1 NAD(P)H-binding protein [Myxococcales bacterium]